MTFKEFWKNLNADDRESFAKACSTTANYLNKLYSSELPPGPKLAQRMADYSPDLTLHELRPDLWKPAA